jgi:hypothetical protein
MEMKNMQRERVIKYVRPVCTQLQDGKDIFSRLLV